MAFKKKFPYKAALVACNGSCGATREEPKCAYGCLGCGACVSACKFGAIHLNDNGVADVEVRAGGIDAQLDVEGLALVQLLLQPVERLDLVNTGLDDVQLLFSGKHGCLSFRTNAKTSRDDTTTGRCMPTR